jgi:hypothetical protein
VIAVLQRNLGAAFGQRIRLAFSALLLRVVLELSYAIVIAPNYGYLGFYYNRLTPAASIGFALLALLPVSWLPTRLARPGDLIALALYCLVVIPASFVPLVSGVANVEAMLWFLLPVLCGHLVICLLPSIVRISPTLMRRDLGWRTLLLGGGALVTLTVATFGLPTEVPTLAELYSVRSAFRASSEGLLGRLSVYSVLWSANVIVPVLLCFGMARRRIVAIAAALAIALLLFSTTGMKTVGAMPIAVALVYWISSKDDWCRVDLVVAACAAVVGAALVVDLIAGSYLVSGIVIRRVFIVPGLLSGYYADFFLSHETYRLSHSIFSGIQPEVHAVSPPFLIGGHYLGNANLSANAHVFSDAYANFGPVGIVLFSGVLALCTLALNWAFDGVSRPMAVAVSTGVAIALTNSALLTVLLTHGFGLLIAIGLTLNLRQGDGTLAAGQPTDAHSRSLPV